MKPIDRSGKPGPAPKSDPGRDLRGRRDSPGRRWRRRVIRTAGALVALYVTARIAYHPLKNFRGRLLAADADRDLNSNDLRAAQKSIHAAYRLAPQEPNVLRAAARYSTKAGLPDALIYWDKLEATGTATTQDRMDLIAAAINSERLDRAQNELQELLPKAPQNRDLLRLAVRTLVELRNYTKATEIARLALAVEPSSDRDQTALGRLLATSAASADRAEGKSLLWSVALSQSTYSSEAIAALSQMAEVNQTETEILLRKAQADTHPTPVERLITGSLELKLSPSRQKAVFDRIFSSFDAAPPAEALQMAQWSLNQAPSLLAAFLTPARIGTNRVYLTIKAEAFANASQWDNLEALLADRAHPLDPATEAWLRARVALARGKRDEAQNQLLAGIEAPGRHDAVLPLLARTAESAGFLPEALRAWERLSEIPAFVVQAGQEALRLAASTSDLAAARRTILRLASSLPGDPSLKGERAVLDLLYNENAPNALEVLGGLNRQHPDNAAWKAGLALARLQTGDAGGALALLEQGAFDWEGGTPRSRAIYIAVLGANGQREAARRFARRIDMEKLRTPERQLVAPWH
jgi:hypothetical protein